MRWLVDVKLSTFQGFDAFKWMFEMTEVSDSRWVVFKTTIWEMVSNYGPRVFFISLLIFTAIFVFKRGFIFSAFVDALVYSLIITGGNIILCTGIAFHIAYVLYRKKPMS